MSCQSIKCSHWKCSVSFLLPAVSSTWNPATYCTVSGLWLWYTLYFIKLQGKNSNVLMSDAPAGHAERPPLAIHLHWQFLFMYSTNLLTKMLMCSIMCSHICHVARGTSFKTAVHRFLEYPCNKLLLKCPSTKLFEQGISQFFTYFLSKSLLRINTSGGFCWNKGEISICC